MNNLTKSFTTTFHRCLLVDANGNTDYDYLHLAKMQKTLTLDSRFLEPGFIPHYSATPFKEISFAPLTISVKKDYQHLLKQPIRLAPSLNEFVQSVVTALKSYILENISGDQRYLMLHSGGFDSRIISACMRDLWNEGWRADIHFRCHQPEKNQFYEIMKREGWDKSQYSYYEGKDDNYYDIGHKEFVMNGWHNYNQAMNYWSDIAGNEKDYVLIIGLGGETYKYSALHSSDSYNRRCTNDLFNLLLHYTPNEGQWDGLYIRRFKDLLMPCFGYGILDKAFRVNRSWCRFIHSANTDSIRLEIAKSFGYNLGSIPHGIHDYTWNLSEDYYRKMVNDFLHSRFYIDNSKKIRVLPDPRKMYKWDAQIWSFMTVYDKLRVESGATFCSS